MKSRHQSTHALTAGLSSPGKHKRMMVFVCDYPSEKDRANGMFERIAAVDSIFSDVPRVYFKIYLRRCFRKKVRQQGLVRIEQVNLFAHHGYIRRLAHEASCIYVHSVFRLLRFLPHLHKVGRKLVLDAHGVVPEEQAYLGNTFWSRIYEWTEHLAMKHAGRVVAVTQKMARHFLNKYPAELDSSRVVVLPMLNYGVVQKPQRSGVDFQNSDSGKLRLVYAGGLGKWQNIDLMLETLQRLAVARPEVHTWIYVPPEAAGELQQRIGALGLEPKIAIASLPRQELLLEYPKMDAGFVLRDNHLLNQVAMPTKLFEYIAHGVVPIVLNPDIGDFLDFRYRYLTIEDLFKPDTFERKNLRDMRVANSKVLSRIEAQTRESIETLRRFASVQEAAMPSLTASR